METYIQQIDLINAYLLNTLSSEDRQNVSERLKDDKNFSSLYHEHLIFLNGIERIQLKKEIRSAKQSYATYKWVKIALISVMALLGIILIYVLTNELEPKNNKAIDPYKNQTSAPIFLLDSLEEPSAHNPAAKVDTVEKTITATPLLAHDEKYDKNVITEPQRYVINTGRDTIIRGKDGSLIKITANSFLDSMTGSAVSGSISFNITEYYKLSDILFANLSTESNGQLLETGGMLFIEAEKNGAQLKLKSDSPVQIYFPKQGAKDGMHLFTGSWYQDREINWDLESSQEKETQEIVEDAIEVPFAVVDRQPIYPGCEAMNDEDRVECLKTNIENLFRLNFNLPFSRSMDSIGVERINAVFNIDTKGFVNSISVRASSPAMEAEAIRVIKLMPRLVPGTQNGRPVTVPYSIPIRLNTSSNSTEVKDSNAINPINARYDTIYRPVRGQIEHYREFMHDPELIVDSTFIASWKTYEKMNLIRVYNQQRASIVRFRKQLLEKEDFPLKILEDDSITRGGHIIRKAWTEIEIPTTTIKRELVLKEQFYVDNELIDEDTFKSKIDASDSTYVNSSDIGYYVFKTSTLGWINCDRFRNTKGKTIKYKIKIKNIDGADVKVVFKNYNSIMKYTVHEGLYDFGKIDKDEPVAIVAIKKGKGELMYDIIDTKTQESQNIIFDFKKTTYSDLRKLIDQIGLFKN